jgi:hypothetical protein
MSGVPPTPDAPALVYSGSDDLTERTVLLEHAMETFWLFINAVIVFWMQVRALA